MCTANQIDERFMLVAIQEARQALAKGNLPIGAVIVHQGKVISAAHNLVDSDHSDLNHAEILAIRKVEGFLFRHKKQCDIYSTVEPCMMCMGAIYNFHFKRLVFAVRDRNAGHSRRCEHLAPSFTRRETEIGEPVLAADSKALLEEYISLTGRRSHLIGTWC